AGARPEPFAADFRVRATASTFSSSLGRRAHARGSAPTGPARLLDERPHQKPRRRGDDAGRGVASSDLHSEVPRWVPRGQATPMPKRLRSLLPRCHAEQNCTPPAHRSRQYRSSPHALPTWARRWPGLVLKWSRRLAHPRRRWGLVLPEPRSAKRAVRRRLSVGRLEIAE